MALVDSRNNDESDRHIPYDKRSSIGMDDGGSLFSNMDDPRVAAVVEEAAPLRYVGTISTSILNMNGVAMVTPFPATISSSDAITLYRMASAAFRSF